LITSEQIRAARALLRWEQRDLAEASKVSLPSIKRLETVPGPLAAMPRTIKAIRTALESAGVTFIDENDDGGPGVRLPKTHAQKRQRESSPTASNGRQIQVGHGRRPSEAARITPRQSSWRT